MPEALFFTYSDGKMIPGREQLFIKGRISERDLKLKKDVPEHELRMKSYSRFWFELKLEQNRDRIYETKNRPKTAPVLLQAYRSRSVAPILV